MAHTNRASITMAEEHVGSALSALGSVEEGLPSLINLDAGERASLPKMGELTRSFVQKAMEIAANNPQFVPPYIDQTELAKDYTASMHLLTVEIQVASLLEKVQDTRILCGSEAYTACLMIYHSIANAERSGVPGAGALHAELASRFPGGSSNPDAEPDPEPEPMP